jgi:hypothetical protein
MKQSESPKTLKWNEMTPRESENSEIGFTEKEWNGAIRNYGSEKVIEYNETERVMR